MGVKIKEKEGLKKDDTTENTEGTEKRLGHRNSSNPASFAKRRLILKILVLGFLFFSPHGPHDFFLYVGHVSMLGKK
ncbi:MAG TPA: hypothetical protein DDW50_11135 [Firmicutes bacterium]|nr:hypothetical protein [Bacillota bacterium]